MEGSSFSLISAATAINQNNLNLNITWHVVKNSV